MSEQTETYRRPIGFAVFLIVAGLVGWYSAFDLTLEKIQTLINPGYVPSCNISPLVSCGPNMASWQGSLFGFPNPVIGVAAFVAPIVVGVAILAGARFAKWFWVLFNLGMALALVFVIWLIGQSIFVLGTLCPYCMLVWLAVIPLFLYVTAFNLKHGHFGNGRASRDVAALVYPWIWLLAILGYLVVVVMAQLRLDAITSILQTL
ncbi:vitamin K epoxide reductase family protein [Herbiconiux sp.]|uniref:vitamin K epoxide reductase family protein n=1 Tax=Herbiconiux sp. TaxID=1871186 RepID=UPI0025C01822|nr:vitamin K epoxide reductase family protein [Herbiconiux sp.]